MAGRDIWQESYFSGSEIQHCDCLAVMHRADSTRMVHDMFECFQRSWQGEEGFLNRMSGLYTVKPPEICHRVGRGNILGVQLEQRDRLR